MTVTVIINPVSGGASPARARRRAEIATGALAPLGCVPEVFVTERAGHARDLAAAALRRGVDRVIAWGGDGTINEIASALAFGAVPLGIVPAGSGNGLARELGIPLRADRAVVHAATAAPRAIDVGEIDGRLFVNVAGIGLDAHVAAMFNTPTNARRGFATYLRLAAAALLHYRPRIYDIDAHGRRSRVNALLLTVANSAQWGNNARIAPGALLDDGKLDLVVVADRRPLSLATEVHRLFTGTIAEMRGCTLDRIERAVVTADRPIPYHVDGEPMTGGTRIEIRVHPGALRVCG